jgi:ABC-type amino acid transport system permease subunit
MDIVRFVQYIANGTAYTVSVSLIALPLGLVLGLLFSLLYVYGGKIVSSIMAF